MRLIGEAEEHGAYWSGDGGRDNWEASWHEYESRKVGRGMPLLRHEVDAILTSSNKQLAADTARSEQHTEEVCARDWSMRQSSA